MTPTRSAAGGSGRDRGRASLPPTPVMGIDLPEPPAFSSPVPPYGGQGPQTMSIPVLRFHELDPVDSSEVTIGVVLDIPEPWAGYLQAAREGFGDLQARTIPTHVTLLPPTSVPRARVDEIAGHLRAVAGSLASFEVRLEGTDTFRPVSPVVFVKIAVGGEGCDVVQRRVRTGPLRRELTFPFHPHVTVAHHLDDEALDRAFKELSEFSATFRADSFVLYEHGADGIWRPKQRFAFGTGPES
ncbi:MAG: hypothetical protein QG622_1566 [Actinomycetota bacterium]|nr:hypothetical protein [Actinomycetota bacterium]